LLPFGPISRAALADKISRGERFHLFEVLPTMYWRKHHLPGAKNLPPTQVATLVPDVVPDRSAEIVLYCWDDDCPTSGWAATELEAMGYTNIREYSAGKKDWIDAGLPMVKD
jgi:rhodanese-related sulfurtransferase